MKRTMAMLAIIMLVALPVFAESGGNSLINHNAVSGELKISKKITKSDKATSKIALTTGKDVLVNAFGDEFDPVSMDKGWYGILGLEIEFE